MILANLPERSLRSVYLNNEQKIRTAAGVRDWTDFKEQIRAIRRAGFAMTNSEVAEGRIGLAAPISRAGLVVAGISMVIVPSEKERASLLGFAEKVVAAASRLSSLLSQTSGAR